jgi:hypothetical protein
VKVRVRIRGGEGEGKGEGKEREMEVGRLKGQGRENEGKRKGKGREWNGKGKGGEREGKGKEKGRERKGKGKGKGREREGESNYFNSWSFGSFQNGFEILKQTERSDNILLEKIPKQNQNWQCFGSNRKKKKSVSQDTLIPWRVGGCPISFKVLKGCPGELRVPLKGKKVDVNCWRVSLEGC